MTQEREREIDKDIENFGYHFILDFLTTQVKDLQDYPPTTKLINSIEQHKETIFYIKRKRELKQLIE